MSYATELQEFNENIVNTATMTPQVKSTFGENFQASFGRTLDTELSISETLVREFGGFDYDDRNDEIKQMRKDGIVSDEEWLAFTRPHGRSRTPRTNYNELAQYLKEERNIDVRTNAEIDEEMRDELARRKEYADRIFARQGGQGFTGELLGGFAGYLLEPANLAAGVGEAVLAVRSAYALSQATTRLGRAIIVGRNAAIAGVVSEAAIQPIIFNWHEEIGEDMTWEDAIINIGAVGATSGLIGAGASVGRDMLIAKFPKLGEAEKVTTETVANYFSEISKEARKFAKDDEAIELVEMEAGNLRGADKDTSAEEHYENLEAYEKTYDSTPPDAPNAEEVDVGFKESDIDAMYQSLVDNDEAFVMAEGALGDFDSGRATEVVMAMERRKNALKECGGL